VTNVPGAGERRPSGLRALDELHRLPANFAPGPPASFSAALGWHVDDYCQPLPPEPPGEPLANGSFEVAQRLMRDYEFADPAIVRAVYHRERPLEQRDMLLEIRFLGLRFHVGVRVVGVHDETRAVGGRHVRVWGWSYQTLQGHFEMGQMDYEVWKWLDDGAVEFRIHAFSRAAPIRNPLVRTGFRIFGRREQARFAHHACRRMARLTAATLRHDDAHATSRVADAVPVRPAREAGRGLLERKIALPGTFRGPAGGNVEAMDGRRLLGIYLDDHLALLAGGEELTKRMLKSSRDGELRDLLGSVLRSLRDDRAAVVRQIEALGRRPNRIKQRLAWAGERAGRLKLNGNATGYSPLSRLLELEGLAGVLGAARALWRALEQSGPEEGRADAARRAARAAELLQQAEALRLVAAEVTLAGGGRRL
jgi:uncharacterized protein (UPF0548 family)